MGYGIELCIIGFEARNIPCESRQSNLVFDVQKRCENMAQRNIAKKNKLKKIREGMLLSKSELARKAGVSPLTIDRIENGYSCRLDTKRKIIQALGLKLSERNRVFEAD